MQVKVSMTTEGKEKMWKRPNKVKEIHKSFT